MATLVSAPRVSLVDGVYKGMPVKISYHSTTVGEGESALRLLAVTADQNCVLCFSDLSDLGISFLALKAGVTRTIALPVQEVNIDFEVYSSTAREKKLGEPPPIHP